VEPPQHAEVRRLAVGAQAGAGRRRDVGDTEEKVEAEARRIAAVPGRPDQLGRAAAGGGAGTKRESLKRG
jgi:hypothetical protein